MIDRRELYARGCVEELAQVIEQIPFRAKARKSATWNPSTFDALVLWTLLRWEHTFLLVALEEMGVDVWKLGCQVDELLGERDSVEADPRLPNPMDGNALPLRPHVDSLLDRAGRHASDMGHAYVGTEHLLLAILAGADERLGLIFDRHAMTYQKVREKILATLATAETIYVTPVLVEPSERFIPPTGYRPRQPTKRGPRGASWDTPAAGVPRRFGMSIVMLMMTLFAVLFAGMTALGTPPAVFAMLTVLVVGVGLGQMLLYGGEYPRAASIWVGVGLFPLEVMAGMAYLANSQDIRTAEGDWAGLTCLFLFSPVLGAGLGYMAGSLTGGAFLFVDWYNARRESSVDTAQQEPEQP